MSWLGEWLFGTDTKKKVKEASDELGQALNEQREATKRATSALKSAHRTNYALEITARALELAADRKHGGALHDKEH